MTLPLAELNTNAFPPNTPMRPVEEGGEPVANFGINQHIKFLIYDRTRNMYYRRQILPLDKCLKLQPCLAHYITKAAIVFTTFIAIFM